MRAIYEVVVGNVGRVAEGNNPLRANSVYATYCKMSQFGIGRCAGEDVTLLRNGEVVKEYRGAQDVVREMETR